MILSPFFTCIAFILLRGLKKLSSEIPILRFLWESDRKLGRLMVPCELCPRSLRHFHQNAHMCHPCVRKHDNLADTSHTLFRTSKHFKNSPKFGAGIICDLNNGLRLNHKNEFSINLKCLSFDIGLVSIILTLSPILAVLPGLCTLNFLRRFINLK